MGQIDNKKKGRGAPDAEPMLTASKKGFIVLFGIQLQKKREFPTVKLGSLQAKKNLLLEVMIPNLSIKYATRIKWQKTNSFLFKKYF